MKTYKVFITGNAKSDIRAIYSWITSKNPAAAVRWLDGLEEHLHSLSQMPLKHKHIPEQEKYPEFKGLHEIIYITQSRSSSYRVIFRIKAATIEVLTIRRHSQDEISGEDL